MFQRHLFPSRKVGRPYRMVAAHQAGHGNARCAKLELAGASRAARQICSTGARVEDASTASVLRARNLPSEVSSAAASFVPPRSAAKMACGMGDAIVTEALSSWHLVCAADRVPA